MKSRWLVALILLISQTLYAAITVHDDRGHLFTFERAPQRIISLAPHITELLYTVGAHAQLVGADAGSDYPAAAKQLPRIGDFSRVNFERVAALKPDLIIGWRSGNRAADIYRVRQMGIPVLLTDAHSLTDVTKQLRLIAQMTGHVAAGERVAREFDIRLTKLRERYASTSPRRVFYQVWDQPLMTVGGMHWINDAITLCGGRNIFAELKGAAPLVSLEAVLTRAPEMIISGDDAPDRRSMWLRFPRLPAVQRRALIRMDVDALHRPTPRVLDGVAKLCTGIARTAR